MLGSTAVRLMLHKPAFSCPRRIEGGAALTNCRAGNHRRAHIRHMITLDTAGSIRPIATAENNAFSILNKAHVRTETYDGYHHAGRDIFHPLLERWHTARSAKSYR
jgi:hypothetical protein